MIFFASAFCRAQGSPEQRSFIEKITRSTGVSPSVQWDEARHTPRFIEGQLTLPSTENKLAIARRFLQHYRSLFGILDADREFSPIKEFVDEMGKTHLRFQQMYQGIAVWEMNSSSTLNLTVRSTVSVDERSRHRRSMFSQR
ncbi:MAG: hypothetical protein ACPL4I_11835 [Bacteroidota bacterium]